MRRGEEVSNFIPYYILIFYPLIIQVETIDIKTIVPLNLYQKNTQEA